MSILEQSIVSKCRPAQFFCSLDVLTKRACDLGEHRDHRLGKAGIVKLLIRKMEYEKSNEAGPSVRKWPVATKIHVHLYVGN